jgi:RNA polymerase sigma factor (sigma-70 family)
MSVPTAHSDVELIAACTHGEAWAWNALVERYRRLVYSIPLRAGLSSEDAEDVFQTIFASLLEHLETIRDAQGLAKWLITSTKRESWNVSRKRMREPADDEAVEKAAGAEEAAQDTRAEEGLWIDQALVRDAFEQMGERCKELLRLLYYDPAEPSYDEISHRLAIPVGSIGPNRARCLGRLRSLLQALGMD